MKNKPVRIIIRDGKVETEWEPDSSEPTCCVEQSRALAEKLKSKGLEVDGSVLHCKLKLSPDIFKQTQNILKCHVLGS